MQKRFMAIGFLLCLAAAVPGQDKPKQSVAGIIRQELLCQFTGGKIVDADKGTPVARWSDDLKQVAVIIREPDGRHTVGLNGKKGPPYARIIPPEEEPLNAALRFSKDFTRFAYVAEHPKGRVIVIDGKESEPYDLVMSGMPVFSPDSSRAAYAVAFKGKIYLVVDGEKGSPIEDLNVGSLAWSDDSSKLAYSYKEKNEWHVVVREFEKKKGEGKNPVKHPPVYPALKGISRDGIVFSANSDRIGYAAHSSKNKWAVYVDGKPVSQPLDAVAEGSLTFSRNSEHYAFAAQQAGAWYVFVDGKPCVAGKNVPPAQAVAERTPRFSDDSTRIVYAIERQKVWSVMLHELKEKGGAAETGSPSATPPASRTGALKEKGVFSETGSELAQGSEVLEGTPRFARNAKIPLYAVKKGGWWVGLSGEGQKLGPYVWIKKRSLIISPDGAQVVFAAEKQAGQFKIFINDKESENFYDKVGQPRISADAGTNTVVISAFRNGAWILLVNNEEKPPWYQSILADETGELTPPDATVVSPNGKRTSFYGVQFGKWALFVDGLRVPCDPPLTYRFNPDTNLLEGIVWDQKNPLVFMSVRESMSK
jgi:Tol biopolymer transport system component